MAAAQVVGLGILRISACKRWKNVCARAIISESGFEKWTSILRNHVGRRRESRHVSNMTSADLRAPLRTNSVLKAYDLKTHSELRQRSAVADSIWTLTNELAVDRVGCKRSGRPKSSS